MFYGFTRKVKNEKGKGGRGGEQGIACVCQNECVNLQCMILLDNLEDCLNLTVSNLFCFKHVL